MVEGWEAGAEVCGAWGITFTSVIALDTNSGCCCVCAHQTTPCLFSSHFFFLYPPPFPVIGRDEQSGGLKVDLGCTRRQSQLSSRTELFFRSQTRRAIACLNQVFRYDAPTKSKVFLRSLNNSVWAVSGSCALSLTMCLGTFKTVSFLARRASNFSWMFMLKRCTVVFLVACSYFVLVKLLIIAMSVYNDQVLLVPPMCCYVFGLSLFASPLLC